MKKNLKNILILVAFLIFAGTIVYADPTSTPLSDNIPAPITQLPVGQVKDGYLGVNKFVVGDYTHDKSNWVIFTSTGKLGLKYIADVNSIPSITENLEVDTGKVRLSEISTAGVAVCADAKGTLTKCQTTTFSHSGNDSKAYETYTYKVPAGVTKITVELYGAGGTGYHQSASSYDRSPDDYNNCAATSGGIYNCSSGGSAFVYDINSDPTQNTKGVLAQAKGGHVALGAHTGGKGGTTSVSSSSKILSKSTQNGEDGGAGSNGASSDSSQTFYCGSKGPYTATIGGNGGLGGYGGNAGPTGGKTPGGNGGRGGFGLFDLDTVLRCAETPSLYNGKGALSEGGLDGQFGSGGSGAGGIGGFSDKGGDLTDNNGDALCKYSGANCSTAEQGYAGGGGGGYTKTQLEVKGGEVYTIKLSHGGEMRSMTEDKGGVWCYYVSKWSCHSGSYSGNGSGAYAKVTVN